MAWTVGWSITRVASNGRLKCADSWPGSSTAASESSPAASRGASRATGAPVRSATSCETTRSMASPPGKGACCRMRTAGKCVVAGSAVSLGFWAPSTTPRMRGPPSLLHAGTPLSMRTASARERRGTCVGAVLVNRDPSCSVASTSAVWLAASCVVVWTHGDDTAISGLGKLGMSSSDGGGMGIQGAGTIVACAWALPLAMRVRVPRAGSTWHTTSPCAWTSVNKQRVATPCQRTVPCSRSTSDA